MALGYSGQVSLPAQFVGFPFSFHELSFKPFNFPWFKCRSWGSRLGQFPAPVLSQRVIMLVAGRVTMKWT